jgi:outer membrane protein
MNWFKYFFALLIVAIVFPASGQQILSKEEAVNLALESNYGIKVAKNDIRIAENNTRIYNTGQLPTVTATAGPNFDVGGSRLTFNTGEILIVNTAASWGANASVNANHTLYDKARSYNVESLRQRLNLSELEARKAVELNVLQLLSNYYDATNLRQALDLLVQTLEVSRRRLQRAQYRYDYGQGSRLDVLNAEVDVQRDSINFLNTRQQLANAKRNVNVVIGRDVNTPFEVDTTVAYTAGLTLETLVQWAKENNVDVLISNKNIDLNYIDLQISGAGKKPTIGTNASYSYNYQDNPSSSFFAKQRSGSISANVILSWNIFDGGSIRTRSENTRVAIESQLVLKQQLEQQLERDVANFWESYQNALYILRAEEHNLSTNRLNFERTEEQYNLGQVTSVEFRQAQLNLLTAATNRNTAKYNAKAFELQLLQLTGDLLRAQY